MLRVDRLILSEIVGTFVFGVLLFTSLFFAGGEIVRFAEFLSLGVSPVTVGRLLLLTLPNTILLTFPMATLLAALLGFGRLSNDSEIVALLANGASFTRLVVPVGAFALLTTGVGLWFGHSVVPAAVRGRETIIREVREGFGGGRSATAFDLALRDDRGRLTTLIHVEGGIDLAPGAVPTLRDVSIQFWDRNVVRHVVYARRAEWIRGTRNWKLADQVQSASWDENSAIAFTGSSALTRDNALVGKQGLVELGTPEEMAALERPVKEVSSRTLRERIRFFRANAGADKAREAEVELAQRVALPFASFVFALVGAPLGVRPQRAGKGVGFGLAILIIFGYWIALQVVSFLGRAGTLPPSFALALPNLVGLVAAGILIRRVLR